MTEATLYRITESADPDVGSHVAIDVRSGCTVFAGTKADCMRHVGCLLGRIVPESTR